MSIVTHKRTLSTLAALLAASSINAGVVAVPNTFEANTTAVAADVNENFAVLSDAIDSSYSSLSTDINNNAADISANAADITGNANDIANNAAFILSNGGGISVNANNITTNAGDIATNTAAITAINSGSVAVSHTAFVNEDVEVAHVTECILAKYSSSAVYLPVGTATSACDVYAPVQLPDGVTLTGLSCTVLDNIATNRLTPVLRAVTRSTGGSSTIYQAPDSVDSSTIQTLTDTTTTAPNVVDNSTKSYHLLMAYSTADFSVHTGSIYGCSISYSE